MQATSGSEDGRWKGLYTAALFEIDRSRMSARIAEAELEIVKRLRVLFTSPGDNANETNALDDALHMLRVLKDCLKLETTERLVLYRAPRTMSQSAAWRRI
jgi:hypothetical protein